MFNRKLFFGSLIFFCSANCFGQRDSAKTEKKEYDATTYLYFATVYHQKGIYDTAYFCYKKAIQMEPSFAPEIIPLLDDLGYWEEIIKTAGPLIAKGDREPSRLGPLYTAYLKTGDTKNAESTINLLTKAKYEDAGDKDYRNYILSYYNLWKGNVELALDLLEKIVDSDIRTYAAKSLKFQSLYANARFKKATRQ